MAKASIYDKILKPVTNVQDTCIFVNLRQKDTPDPTRVTGV